MQGTASLVSCLKKDADYIGFEPNEERAELCRKAGLHVVNDLFDRNSVAEASVDAVVIDNVLEHVLEPETLIADSQWALKESGVIIIIVPSVNDIRRYVKKWKERHHFQRVHINYFSQRHLCDMLIRNGFDPHPFGFKGFELSAVKLFPYALADYFGVHPFGLYYYGIRQVQPNRISS